MDKSEIAFLIILGIPFTIAIWCLVIALIYCLYRAIWKPY